MLGNTAIPRKAMTGVITPLDSIIAKLLSQFLP
jgi:hypothetical protein